MGIKYIDAKRLRRVLIGGGKWLQKYEAYLNELNVYPVPDGDTGTNMCMTAASMIKEIEENSNDKTSLNDLAVLVEDAVLIGARGNSGTILSQIINGFLKGIEGKKRLVPSDITIALKSAKELAYNVVSTPIEGTMLTVIRRIYERSVEIKDYEYFNEYIEELVIAADKAVEDTPNLLPKLKEAGVVDSGGKGLFYFFEGMSKVLTEIELLTKASVIETEFDKTILNIDHNSDEIKYKYCTEFIITNMDFDIDELKKELLEIGDSAVFAKSSKKFKTHIHTNNPGIAIEIAAKRGDLKNIKIENMKLQNEGVLENEKDLSKIFTNKKIDDMKKEAFVVLADTVELKNELLKLGADVVILGGQSQNPSVSDILNGINKVVDNDKHVYILANNKNVISTANLASEKVDRTVIVVPTKTMLEGLFYLKYKYTSIKEKNQMNEKNVSIEVTKAVRDTVVDGIEIKVDDYLLLVNTKIKYANSSIDNIINEIIAKYISNNTISMTIVQGANKHLKLTEKLKEVSKNFIQETVLIDSDMKNYDYYILIENKDENMPEIAIMTDSASDLSVYDIEKFKIPVIPIRLTDSKNENYKDGVNLDKDRFWELLIDEKRTFKTAQPSPKEIVNMYLEQFEKGYKKILVVGISSKLSGEYQVLKLAREISKKENDIEIFDTKAVSILQGYLVKSAIKKASETNKVEDIVNYLTKLRDRSKMYIVIDTLEYLYNGGRISKASKTVGDFLNLKPVITMVDGSLSVEKKVFGGENSVIKYIEKSIRNKYLNQSIFVTTAYGGKGQLDFANRLNKEILENNRKVSIIKPLVEIGPTVGTHAGPVTGVLFVPKLL